MSIKKAGAPLYENGYVLAGDWNSYWYYLILPVPGDMMVGPRGICP